MGNDPRKIVAGRRARVLVTGGAGFIGSHLAERLVKERYRVAIVDDLNDYYDPRIKRENLRSIRKTGRFAFHRADIRDRAAMERVFRSAKPEIVLHLAARAGVRPSLRDPSLYADVNVNGTINLLELARIHGVKKFVFGSSSSVYGGTKIIPFREDDISIQPVSPYGVSKLAGEYYCRVYHELYGTDIACLRFFTVYGPRQRPDMAISHFTTSVLSGKPISMFGSGDTQRDYTYVSDIVDGIVSAMKKRGGFRIYNLGESRCIKLRDLIALIEKETGKKAIVKPTGEQPGDVRFTRADVSRSRRELGYRPRFPVEEGIKRYVAYLTRHDNQ